MLDSHFAATKAITSMKMVDSKEQLVMKQSSDMMTWLDPSLAEAANRLLIYQTLKAKVSALDEYKKLEDINQSDEQE